MARRRSRQSVLIVGSEALPFAKTGGLADVLGALPPALGAARLGRHGRAAAVSRRRRRRASLEQFPSPSAATRATSAFHEAPLADERARDARRLPRALRSRRAVRRRPTSTIRTTRALRVSRARRARIRRARGGAAVGRSRARLAGRARAGLSADAYATHPVLGGMPSVFTIHNLAYQGLFDADWLPRLDLGMGSVHGRSARVLGPHQLSEGRHRRRRRRSRPSAGATREEIQTPEFGFGFDGILRAATRRSRRHPERHRHDRVGSGDTIGSCRRRSTRANLSGKSAAKAAVLDALRSARPTSAALERPLIGMVSRMVDQKGFDLDRARSATTLPRSTRRSSCSARASRGIRTCGRRSRRGIRTGSARRSASTRRWRI